MERSCLACGDSFTRRSNANRYCLSCRPIRPAPRKDRVCAQCGLSYEFSLGGYKFCSQSCNRASGLARAKQRYEESLSRKSPPKKGSYEHALGLVNEGLRTDPANAELLDLKRKLYELKRRERRDAVSRFVRNWKERHPCQDCGEFFPAEAMDFHHRDPATKSFEISGRRGRSLERVKEEIAKCDLLCATHHRLRQIDPAVARLRKEATIQAFRRHLRLVG